MKRSLLVLTTLGLLGGGPAWRAAAVMPRDGRGAGKTAREERDQPNPAEVRRIQERRRLLRELSDLERRPAAERQRAVTRKAELEKRLAALQLASDQVLVILVEFAGTNTFTWTPGSSTWDPLGRCERPEYDGVNYGNAAASTFFANHYGFSAASNFTYIGPLHNQIPRPLSAADASGDSIWTEDFSPAYYSNIVFGSGWNFNFTREDSSVVKADHTGQSVRQYYLDLSSGAYDIEGEVVGWVQVTNSTWWYGADGVPGRRSGANSAASHGAIPGAGSSRSLVIDALLAVKAAYPAFNWARFDTDDDGVIDRLWIIHAGFGEEDDPILLNRTTYGEGALWSHSWSLATPYEIVPGISASAYIMMPENSGIGVLAHEYAHNLGADDLYTYGDGETSVGFWSLMSDDWTGFPLGFQPQAPDPLHLDNWGWLNPLVITNPALEYTVTLGQPSRFPGGSQVYRAAKIKLPDQAEPLAVQPRGAYQWWGGAEYSANALMIQRTAIHIPAGGAELRYDAAYETEMNYDWFSIWVTTNNRVNWDLVASTNGTSDGFPAYRTLSNSLNAFINHDVRLAFQYSTDYSVLGAGAFVDEVSVVSGVTTLLQDNAESDSGLWDYSAPWTRNDGHQFVPHAFYLQWRNTAASGGYDSTLGGTNWRFGPIAPGLLVWYHNERFADNEIVDYLADGPAYGPKGQMLVVDAHPEPYRDPWWLAQGFTNEQANISDRCQMRDAAFTLSNTPAFRLDPPFVHTATNFPGRPAIALFSDALGYYPGLEWAVPPGAPGRWMTAQWDSSVVLPCASPYGLKPPVYPGGVDLSYIVQERITEGTNEFLAHTTNVVSGGTTAGGTGNPGAGTPAYGWNVRLLSESGTQATVRVWNGSPLRALAIHPAGDNRLTVACEPLPGRALSLEAATGLTGSAGFAAVTNFPNASNVTVRTDGAQRLYRVGIQ